VSGSSVPFRVVGREPLLDAIYNGAWKVGCSGCVFELICKLRDELVTPSCPRVAGVRVRYGLGLNALGGISEVTPLLILIRLLHQHS
jgi:hypothetical protein